MRNTDIQHTDIQHTDIQHTTYNIQHTTYNVQHTDIQHTGIQHTGIQHTGIQHTSVQHTTYNSSHQSWLAASRESRKSKGHPFVRLWRRNGVERLLQVGLYSEFYGTHFPFEKSFPNYFDPLANFHILNRWEKVFGNVTTAPMGMCPLVNVYTPV